MSFDQKLELSGEMIVRGLGTVFMVLIILWVILALFGLFFGKTEKKPGAASKQVQAPTPSPAPTVPAPAPVADDGALIAAITAAIEAYRTSEGTSALPFRVVSFKRKNGASGWNGTTSEN